MKRKGVNYERRKSQRKQARETLDNVELYSLVFPASNGAAQSVHNASERDFKAALDLAGFDDSYSFESLRHTNLSLLAEEISPRRLQKHAGHQRIETTLKYYVHIDDKEHDVVPDKVAGLLY
jgi:integrase